MEGHHCHGSAAVIGMAEVCKETRSTQVSESVPMWQVVKGWEVLH